VNKRRSLCIRESWIIERW